MKILKLTLLFFIVFCTCVSLQEDNKSQKAQELYGRICAMVYTTNYTVEWQNIEKNILENKDTLFMVSGNDFQILVKKTGFPIVGQPMDTLSKTSEPINTNGSWK